MSFDKFFNTAVSSWMSQEGPDSDIVLSSRIRLARNIVDFRFPTVFSNEEAEQIVSLFEQTFAHRFYRSVGRFELLKMS